VKLPALLLFKTARFDFDFSEIETSPIFAAAT
jgi:hypothetical protein